MQQIVMAVFAVVAALMLTVAAAVPLEAVADADDDMQRTLLLQRFLASGPGRLQSLQGLGGDGLQGLMANRPMVPQKRYRPPRQGRSGGMSLCLWKVCPAAPWLVSKRDATNY